jgi:hypothetical protein
MLTLLLTLACGTGVPADTVHVVSTNGQLSVDGNSVGSLSEGRNGLLHQPLARGLAERPDSVHAVMFELPADTPLHEVLPLLYTAGEAGLSVISLRIPDGPTVHHSLPTFATATSEEKKVLGVMVQPMLSIMRTDDGVWVEGSAKFTPKYQKSDGELGKTVRSTRSKLDASCDVFLEHKTACEAAQASGSWPAGGLGPDDGCVVAPGHNVYETTKTSAKALGLPTERTRPILMAGPGAQLGDAIDVWRGLVDAGTKPPHFGKGVRPPNATPQCHGAVVDEHGLGVEKARWLGAATHEPDPQAADGPAEK